MNNTFFPDHCRLSCRFHRLVSRADQKEEKKIPKG
jgi:hypothetical protein